METPEKGQTEASSGVGGNRNSTISYYDKGLVVGLLLDARIRRLTGDRKSLDDGMRLGIARYSGTTGFTPEQFEQTMREVAGVDLAAFFSSTLRSTEELDYRDMLDWFGLQFAEPGAADPAVAWKLVVRADATDAQRRHLDRLMASSAPAGSHFD
jgi:predicted metalloprotease with PDZ domain